MAQHHTVPRFYLSRFGDPPGAAAARIDAVNIQSGKRLRRVSVANIGKEGHFYSIPNEPPEERDDLERLIAVHEGPWAEALRVMEAGLPIDDQTRATIAQFVAVQHLRTTRTRKIVEDMVIDFATQGAARLITEARRAGGDAAARQQFRDLTGDTEPDDSEIDALLAQIEARDYRGFTLRADPSSHLGLVLDGMFEEKFWTGIYHRNWRIVRAPTFPAFATSDHPVSMIPGPKRMAGLATAAQVRLPLSPDRILIMDRGRKGHSRERAASDEEVGTLNHNTIWYADRWLYLHPEMPDAAPPSSRTAATRTTQARRRRLMRR